MELNRIQDTNVHIDHKKQLPVQKPETEVLETVKTPNNPDFYKSYKGVGVGVNDMIGAAILSDIKNTEKTKQITLDGENFTVKSYKKNDKEYILTDEGKLYRVRYSKNKAKNAETVLASKLYNLAGVKTPDMKVFESNGMNGYVSEYMEGLAPMESNPEALYSAFGADAWLGNWNTFNHGNTGIDKDGNPVKVVTSGSLTYRASGKKKDSFDSEVNEIDTMRDSTINPEGAKLLVNMSDEDLKKSLEKVTSIKNNDIILAVKQSQIENKQTMIDTLISRKESLADINNFKSKPAEIKTVQDEDRLRKQAQLDNYLRGEYMYKDSDPWFEKAQKRDIDIVREDINKNPEKREIYEDILDISFYEYKDKRDLGYKHDLHKFAGYPADRMKILVKLAAVKKFGYTLPANEPETYYKLDNISNEKLSYIIDKCGIKSVDAILEMDQNSFDALKLGANLCKKYGIEDRGIVNNIIKFASNLIGDIPDYKRKALETLLEKDDEFKKPYGSYYSNGPVCLASSVMEQCESKEKTDYIMNTVFPVYEKITPEYDKRTSFDIRELSKDGADIKFESEKIDFLRNKQKLKDDDYYESVLKDMDTREKFDIYKDLVNLGFSYYDATGVMSWSHDYKTDTYKYEVIDFAKNIHKQGFRGELFNSYIQKYSICHTPEEKQAILDDIQKIQERDLMNIKMTDRKPPESDSYYPNDDIRGLYKEEVNILKDIPLEKMNKVKELLDIPERKGYCRFRINEIAELITLDENADEKAKKYNMFKTELTAKDIMILSQMKDETLEKMDKRGLIRPLEIQRKDNSYAEIYQYFDSFDDNQWDKFEKRYLSNEDIRYISLDQLQVLMNMDDKLFNRIESENLFEKCPSADKVFQYFDFVEYEKASNINELSAAQKRGLLKKLVKYNRSLFNSDFQNISSTPQFTPKNQEEYCALMQELVKSIGLNYKPISDTTKADYYNSLTNLENIHGEFLGADLTKEGLKLDLAYPRDKFISDIEEKLAPLSEKERAKVTNYFGFELKEYEDGRKMNGYPVDNDSDTYDMNYSTREAVREIKPFVKRFTEDNKILTNDTISPSLAKDLNNITKAFPEFYTIIGKPQHKTHSYTVDIHTLNVLQNAMKNPKYRYLPEKDRRILQTSILFHDLTKLENSIDKTHEDSSAYDAYYLTDKLNLFENEHLQIYHLIKNHNFLEKYNSSTAKDYAYELRQGNNFKMESILTAADLKSVKRDGSFYLKHKDTLNQADTVITKLVDKIQSTAICMPQTKLPKASELKNVREEITYNSKGEPIRNKVIYLKPGMDLKEIGFKDNIKSEDLNLLVHGLDKEEQSAIFQALGQVDSNGLLSTSYINYGKGNYHVFRQQGFILDVPSEDINAAYYKDFGSGYGKTLSALKKDYLYDGPRKDIRNYMSDRLKEEMNLSDEEYKKLYPAIMDKSISELDEENPQAAKAIRNVIETMDEGKRRGGRQYNEILVSRPKIQGVFYQGKLEHRSYQLQDVPEFLREYAAKNDVPIIYFGE